MGWGAAVVDPHEECQRHQAELSDRLDLQREEARRAVERARLAEAALEFVLETHELYDEDGVYTLPDGTELRRG